MFENAIREKPDAGEAKIDSADIKREKERQELYALPERLGESAELNRLPDRLGEREEAREEEVQNTDELKTRDVNEYATRKEGGSYGELKSQNGREGKEIHHIPANESSPLKTNDGPAIEMGKSDHGKTASWGNSRDAREYSAKQKELIEQGKFNEAFQMDVDDIHEKFGDKYDKAIAESQEYINKLIQEGKIDG